MVDNDHSSQNEITELMINEAFEKNLEKSIAELRQAIDDQDISNLQKTAHNFRSSCLSVKFMKAAEDCLEIEKSCLSGDRKSAMAKTLALIDRLNFE